MSHQVGSLGRKDTPEMANAVLKRIGLEEHITRKCVELVFLVLEFSSRLLHWQAHKLVLTPVCILMIFTAVPCQAFELARVFQG